MKRSAHSVIELVYIALFAVVIAICSQIAIPTQPPFTLQTFAVFCACGILGAKRAGASVLLYILLGSVGVPVFSGLKGSLGVLLGPTGGYIVGFLPAVLVYGVIVHFTGKGKIAEPLAMFAGLICCYVLGTTWYALTFLPGGIASFGAALLQCVLPFIIPDIAKIALAAYISRRLRPTLKLK